MAENEHEDQPETSDDTDWNDTEIEELPETELTSSQKIKQRSNMYGNASRSATHTNGGDDLEQSQLSVGDNQVDNKI